MVLAEGGAAGRHRRRHAGQVAGHHVGVPLDDHRLAPLGDLPLGQVGAVKHLALLEDLRFRGVQVLRVVVGVELARAKRDRLPRQVPDRPHQPAAEHVDEPAAARPAGQARLEQLVLGEAPGPQELGQLVPRRRGVADAELAGVVHREAALGQEGLGDAAGVGMGAFDVKLLGLPVRLDQPPALACLLAGDVAAGLVAELDARAGGQALDRLAELQALQLHDELDDVAALAAGEAVVQLLARRDVERGGALVMEGAQALHVTAARWSELEVLAHNVHDR